MNQRLLALVLSAATGVVTAGASAAADSGKAAPSLPSSAVVSAVGRIPTPRPKANTELFLYPVDAYIGTAAVVTPRVTFSGGSADIHTLAAPCRFQVLMPPLPERTLELQCNKPFSIDIPENLATGDFHTVNARVLGSVDYIASAWANAKVTYRKSPTKLTLTHGAGQLPASLAPFASVTAAEDVYVAVNKMLPSGVSIPLPGRSVQVNVEGGQTGPVPQSDASGLIRFQVIHVPAATPKVQLLFLGDGAYGPSSVSAVLTPSAPHKTHH